MTNPIPSTRGLMIGVALLVGAPLKAIADEDARPLVVHVPPLASEPGAPIELVAELDAPVATDLIARWRSASQPWSDVPFARSSAGGWFATLPASAVDVEYFIVSRPASGGGELTHFASASAPQRVRVDHDEIDRAEASDLGRMAGRRNAIAVDVSGHDFGNRYQLADRFLRGELTFTHHPLRTLYYISFGFGSVGGETPVESAPTGTVVGKALRYGFGEVRLRLHPSVFVDARASLGASHNGFDQGVRGQIIFGKPWRSSLSIGGEYLGDVGASAWVRLQWDTAPPLLMGAAIVRSDLPGAVIDQAGLYLAYDVAYTLASRWTLKAQLSYGSRDGAAHFGGGLGTALAF